MLNKIWNDEAGAIVSAEIVLVATILVIGMVVGLKSVRDAVVTELADVGQAISNINQSFDYTGVTGHGTSTAGSVFADTQDYCDGADIADSGMRCVAISTVTPTAEGAQATAN